MLSAARAAQKICGVCDEAAKGPPRSASPASFRLTSMGRLVFIVAPNGTAAECRNQNMGYGSSFCAFPKRRSESRFGGRRAGVYGGLWPNAR
jgi:hypothetical protein